MPTPLSNDKRCDQDQLEFVMIWLSVITTALRRWRGVACDFVGIVFWTSSGLQRDSGPQAVARRWSPGRSGRGFCLSHGY